MNTIESLSNFFYWVIVPIILGFTVLIGRIKLENRNIGSFGTSQEKDRKPLNNPKLEDQVNAFIKTRFPQAKGISSSQNVAPKPAKNCLGCAWIFILFIAFTIFGNLNS